MATAMPPVSPASSSTTPPTYPPTHHHHHDDQTTSQHSQSEGSTNTNPNQQVSFDFTASLDSSELSLAGTVVTASGTRSQQRAQTRAARRVHEEEDSLVVQFAGLDRGDGGADGSSVGGLEPGEFTATGTANGSPTDAKPTVGNSEGGLVKIEEFALPFHSSAAAATTSSSGSQQSSSQPSRGVLEADPPHVGGQSRKESEEVKAPFFVSQPDLVLLQKCLVRMVDFIVDFEAMVEEEESKHSPAALAKKGGLTIATDATDTATISSLQRIVDSVKDHAADLKQLSLGRLFAALKLDFPVDTLLFGGAQDGSPNGSLTAPASARGGGFAFGSSPSKTFDGDSDDEFASHVQSDLPSLTSTATSPYLGENDDNKHHKKHKHSKRHRHRKLLSASRRQSTLFSTTLVKDRADDGLKTINNYTILDELGRGTYGKVKLAAVGDSNNMRAIKIIPKRLLRDKYRFTHQGNGNDNDDVSALSSDGQGKKKDAGRFHKEVAIMKKLKHRNIVRLYEVIDDPDSEKLYMVMEYVERGPIVSVDNDGRCTALDIDVAKGYMKQIANAVAYLHSVKICHRDIKPDNILLGANGLPYLCDFGVSSMLTDEDGHLQTDAGRTVGTPIFLAPEEYNLAVSISALPNPFALDIWALGVTFYCMIFGKLPFSPVGSYNDIAERVLEDPIDFTFEHLEPSTPMTPGLVGSFSPVSSPLQGKDSFMGLAAAESLGHNHSGNTVATLLQLDRMGSGYMSDFANASIGGNQSFIGGNSSTAFPASQQEEAVVDLLRGMLERDVAKRFTIQQVRKHPFFTGKPRHQQSGFNSSATQMRSVSPGGNGGSDCGASPIHFPPSLVSRSPQTVTLVGEDPQPPPAARATRGSIPAGQYRSNSGGNSDSDIAPQYPSNVELPSTNPSFGSQVNSASFRSSTHQLPSPHQADGQMTMPEVIFPAAVEYDYSNHNSILLSNEGSMRSGGDAFSPSNQTSHAPTRNNSDSKSSGESLIHRIAIHPQEEPEQPGGDASAIKGSAGDPLSTASASTSLLGDGNEATVAPGVQPPPIAKEDGTSTKHAPSPPVSPQLSGGSTPSSGDQQPLKTRSGRSLYTLGRPQDGPARPGGVTLPPASGATGNLRNSPTVSTTSGTTRSDRDMSIANTAVYDESGSYSTMGSLAHGSQTSNPGAQLLHAQQQYPPPPSPLEHERTTPSHEQQALFQITAPDMHHQQLSSQNGAANNSTGMVGGWDSTSSPTAVGGGGGSVYSASANSVNIAFGPMESSIITNSGGALNNSSSVRSTGERSVRAPSPPVAIHPPPGTQMSGRSSPGTATNPSPTTTPPLRPRAHLKPLDSTVSPTLRSLVPELNGSVGSGGLPVLTSPKEGSGSASGSPMSLLRQRRAHNEQTGVGGPSSPQSVSPQLDFHQPALAGTFSTSSSVKGETSTSSTPKLQPMQRPRPNSPGLRLDPLPVSPTSPQQHTAFTPPVGSVSSKTDHHDQFRLERTVGSLPLGQPATTVHDTTMHPNRIQSFTTGHQHATPGPATIATGGGSQPQTRACFSESDRQGFSVSIENLVQVTDDEDDEDVKPRVATSYNTRTSAQGAIGDTTAQGGAVDDSNIMMRSVGSTSHIRRPSAFSRQQ